ILARGIGGSGQRPCGHYVKTGASRREQTDKQALVAPPQRGGSAVFTQFNVGFRVHEPPKLGRPLSAYFILNQNLAAVVEERNAAADAGVRGVSRGKVENADRL